MATPQAIFTDLCARFELSDAVRDQIVSMGISSLSEFRYYVTTAAELEALFITPIRDLDNRRLQLARLRHCWSATVAAEAQRESSSSTPLQLDEDECLPASQITGIRDMFWARYHLVYPPEFTPSDRVITKAQRALAKRSLEVIDLWQVRSIANQRMTQAKRRRVAPDIWVGGDPDETGVDPVHHSWFTYLGQMRLYFLSLAMAGSTKLEPQPAAPESATTSSTDYVQVPLDLLMRYLCRAESLALRIPEKQRLSHLETLDRAERAEWAHRLANSSQSLGRIIAAVFVERDSHWAVPLPPPPPAAPAASAAALQLRPAAAMMEPALLSLMLFVMGSDFVPTTSVAGAAVSVRSSVLLVSTDVLYSLALAEFAVAPSILGAAVPMHVGLVETRVPPSESCSSRGVALQILCQTICSPQILADPWICCNPLSINPVTLMTASQKSPVSSTCFRVLGFHFRLLFNGPVGTCCNQ